MYLLYLDDSGSINNSNEEYFVLGGVCVPETSVRWLNYEIEKLAIEIKPDNPRLIEFHASEIFSGRDGVWGEMKDKAARIGTIKKVLKVLDKAYSEIVAFACAVHKKSYPNQDPVNMAFEDLSSRFDMYVQRMSNSQNSDNFPHKGIIVLDKSSYENSLQSLATSFRLEGNKWGSYLKNICEVPMFVDSRATRIIQLADHIAYAVFRRYNADDLNYFNCIEGRFDRDLTNGTIHGLAHKQTFNRTCTCPACLTRR